MPAPRGQGQDRSRPAAPDKGPGESPSAAGDGSAAPKSPRTEAQRRVGEVQNLTQRADLLASRGKYAEALPLVDEALRLEPRRSSLHLGRGQCLTHLGQLEEAVAAFDAALRLEPNSAPAVRARAGALVRQERWADAASCLREALERDACNSELRVELARCLTERGVQVKLSGQPAKQLFLDALQASESYPQAYFHIGVEHSEAEEHAQAKAMYSKAVQLLPSYVEAWNNLGVACRNLKEPDLAVEAYGMALKTNKNCTKTRENMAIALLEVGCQSLQRKDYKRASSVLKRALTFNSQNVDVFFNLGVMYAEVQKYDRALVQYELATRLDPKHTTAYNNLGVIHRRQGNMEAAIHCFEMALKADASMTLASKNLGAVYGHVGRMADSIRLTKIAVEANPQDAEALNNLALLNRDQGDVDICIEHLDKCLSLDPSNIHAWSNRLMTLNYPSEKSREEVFQAHKDWGCQLERRVPATYSSWEAPSSDAEPIRVGYISPDFYSHSVSYFIHAALQYHDPSRVHVTCYSDVAVEDDKTRLFRSFVPRWRSIVGLPDDEVAKMIHADSIDIIVDLTGHTGNNRLAALARRPAPVVVTWVGYPHTTGLTRVDYRISDEHADPPIEPGLTTEKLAYLPECFLCYTPPESAPPVSLRPAQETYGCPTFGCFNNLAKVSTLTVRLWSRVLHEVPDARLFLKSKALRCPEAQDKFRRLFAAHGVQPERLDLSGLQPQTGGHLQMYSLVDVALDTAPYAGTTTTCEALYMGVPVLTLRGSGIHAQSVGASLLSAVQLGDLAASTEDDFVQKAGLLARDLRRLAALRAGLRTRMLRSVLCNGQKHTAELERLYTRLVASGPGRPPRSNQVAPPELQ